MVVVYPLSVGEERMVQWAVRIIPIVAVVIVLFLGAISVASAAG